jgi:hypothetical protein
MMVDQIYHMQYSTYIILTTNTSISNIYIYLPTYLSIYLSAIITRP